MTRPLSSTLRGIMRALRLFSCFETGDVDRYSCQPIIGELRLRHGSVANESGRGEREERKLPV